MTESTKYSHFLSLPKGLSKSGQKPNPITRIGFVLVGILLAVLSLNALVSALTEGVIYPGVSVAGTDLSFKTRAQALEILRQKSGTRKVTVKIGKEKSIIANNADFGASYDPLETVEVAYNIGRNSPLGVLGLLDAQRRGGLGLAYRFDQAQLKRFAAEAVGSNGRDPVNATISISDGVATVVEDQPGLQLDPNALASVLTQAMGDGQDTVVSIEPSAVPAPIQKEQALAVMGQVENLLSRSITLTYQGKTFSPTKADIGHWLIFEPVLDGENKSLKVDISRAQIQGYLQSVANQVDVAPTNRKITVLNGQESETQPGKDGTAINQQSATDAIYTAIANNQNTTVALTSGPIPFKTEYKRVGGAIGGLDSPQYIEINLSTQQLFAWQNSQVVFTSPVVTGKDSAPTITGLFAIYTKERNRYLNGAPYGYDYNVFVTYWMPFVGGYGLHDASWRPPSWFGTQAFHYNGSHGCVNMLTGAAAFIWSWAPVGTPVWVHY
jgi:lipoprotein-anchoring transpeptidase ErfK/SrfK